MHQETATQSLGTHLESVTYVYDFALGCAVAPNNRVASSQWLQNNIDWFFGEGSSLPRYLMNTPFGDIVRSLDASSNSFTDGENTLGTLHGVAAAGAIAGTILSVADVRVPGESTLFRGGSSLEARLGVDVKAAEDGLIHTMGKNGRPQGLSLNINPRNVNIQKYGGAFSVKGLPEGLRILQSGAPGHYVIAPSTPMTFERFQQLVKQVTLGNSNAIP